MDEPFSEKSGLIWINGEFLNWPDAKIHIGTHGLHYGSTIFEGIRAYEGVVFRLDAHIDRFYNSANILDFKIYYTKNEFKNIIYRLLKKQNLQYAYIRPIAFRGSDELKIVSKPKISIAIAAWEFTGTHFSDKLSPVKMKIASIRKAPKECFPYNAKTSSMYPMVTVETNKAKEEDFDDCLFLDTNNYVTEASSSNIFIVKNENVYTPNTDCILNGITRQTIINIAKTENITILENNLTLENLKNADEIFLTGTASGIIPVGQIEDIKYNKHNFCNFFRKKYRELIYEEIQRKYNCINNTI